MDAGASSQGGDGGAGSPNVYAYGPTQPVTYAGGGAGNGWGGAAGNGGAGGGADAGPGLATPTNRMGVPGTGGGGAGAQADEYSSVIEASGGNGGSGVVVVRYQLAQKRSQKATGGAISHHNGKTIHTFVNTGVFTVPGSFNETVEYLLVGGGGAGGMGAGGGGGAGGFKTGSTVISGGSPISVVVGGGGQASRNYLN